VCLERHSDRDLWASSGLVWAHAERCRKGLAGWSLRAYHNHDLYFGEYDTRRIEFREGWVKYEKGAKCRFPNFK
jgi:hypothetical protein